MKTNWKKYNLVTFCNNQDSSWPQVKVIPQGIGKYKENEKYVDLSSTKRTITRF